MESLKINSDILMLNSRCACTPRNRRKILNPHGRQVRCVEMTIQAVRDRFPSPSLATATLR
ncbi:MAG: hypothetical protein K8R46_05765 [Pirellulales bacterium]|nr:hypothetical protein [Pirellulales bacterium]